MTYLSIFMVSLVCFLGTAIAAEPKKTSPHDCSLSEQKARLKGIKDMQRLGVLYKIEVPGPLPHAYMGPPFYPLTIDQKRTLLWVIHGYAECEGWGTILRIFDSRTGKEIGSMDTLWGLQLK